MGDFPAPYAWLPEGITRSQAQGMFHVRDQAFQEFWRKGFLADFRSN